MGIKYYKQITVEEKNEIGKEEANKYINDTQRNSANYWIDAIDEITRFSGIPCGEIEKIEVACTEQIIIVNITVNYYDEGKISLTKLIWKDGKYMFRYKINGYEEINGKLDKSVFEKYFYDKKFFQEELKIS